MSEDPFLAGEMAVEYIEGVQSEGVGVSLKHFAANSQEFRRMTSSSEIDERALREIYLSAFERAVKRAKPYTVMCSYNRVNGTYAAENKRLLKDILRDEWGFDGMVVSDWGAVTDRVEGIRAGMNLQMPTANGVTDREIVKAVKEGKLDEAVLDERVRELIDVIFKCHRNKQAKKGYKADFEAHRKLAEFIREAGIDFAGVFAYSREEGTPADRMRGHLPEDVKQARADELRAIENEVIERNAASLIGSRLKVLADGIDYDRQCFVGHTERQTPDVDSVVYFTSDEEVHAGEFYTVEAVSRDGIDLIGRTV